LPSIIENLRAGACFPTPRQSLPRQLLGFSADRKFGHCVDVQLLIDLLATPEITLSGYMDSVAANNKLPCALVPDGA